MCHSTNTLNAMCGLSAQVTSSKHSIVPGEHERLAYLHVYGGSCMQSKLEMIFRFLIYLRLNKSNDGPFVIVPSSNSYVSVWASEGIF